MIRSSFTTRLRPLPNSVLKLTKPSHCSSFRSLTLLRWADRSRDEASCLFPRAVVADAHTSHRDRSSNPRSLRRHSHVGRPGTSNKRTARGIVESPVSGFGLGGPFD